MNDKLKFEEIVEKCNIVHNGKYRYLDLIKKNGRKYIVAKCENGHIFEQLLYDHLRGRGCKYCNGGVKKSKEEWIKEFKEVHNNDYEYLDFFEKRNKIGKFDKYFKIKCLTCGNVFIQLASFHKKGGGCSKCGYKKSADKRKTPFEELKTKIRYVNPDYELLEYNTGNRKIKLKCHKHNTDFYIFKYNALNGQTNCPMCKFEKRSKVRSYSLDEWKNKAIKNGVDVNNYVLLNILAVSNTTRKRGLILCKKHNVQYEQLLDSYSDGFVGCPQCKTFGKAQNEVADFLLNLGVKVEQNNRKLLNGKEIDIYLPDYNLGIEFNGVYWHSEFNNEELYHIENKRLLAESKGIHLINIYDDDWAFKQDIVKSILKNRLGLIKNKIYARNTLLKEINSKVYRNFNEQNHIMGSRNAKYKVGLYYNNDLVAVAGFSDNELIRFTIKKELSVIGGLGKVVKWFTTNISDEVFTYVDLDYFTGNSYKKIGFKVVGLTKPKYWYVYKNGSNARISRQKFQKHKLKNLFDNFDPKLTEVENCHNNGYYRIFGCSNLKLLYKKDC